MHHELANALLVVDVVADRSAGPIAAQVREFISEHTDDYKVIIGTKPWKAERFHPDLQAIPDTDRPYSADNVDFDSIFVSNGFPNTWMRSAPLNPHDETLYDYLERHGIARLDVIGVGVAPLSFEARSLGYATTVLASLCTAPVCGLDEFYQRNVQVEGWNDHLDNGR